MAEVPFDFRLMRREFLGPTEKISWLLPPLLLLCV